MLGGLILLKSHPEHDAIIRNMIVHRLLVDSTPFRYNIFAKNVIFTILRYFGNFQYFGPEMGYVGGCMKV